MTRQRGGAAALMVALAFAAGIVVGWRLRGGPPLPSTIEMHDRPDAVAAAGPASVPVAAQKPVATTGRETAVVDDLRNRDLRRPIDKMETERLKGMFAEPRDAGGRAHEAVDILAPRNTPIHAVEDGTVAKLFRSKAGGNTIYQFDPTVTYCYYYAHLERYAPGLHDGAAVHRGDVVGFVGTSGNAPPNTPHLHFAIFALGAEHEWWKGTPIDPYLVFRK